MIRTPSGDFPSDSPYQQQPQVWAQDGMVANTVAGNTIIRPTEFPQIASQQIGVPSIPIQVGTYINIVGGVVTYVGDNPPPVTTTIPTTVPPPTTLPPTTLPPTTFPPTTVPPTTLPPTTLPPTTMPPTTMPPTSLPPTTLPPTTMPPTTVPPTTAPPTTIPPPTTPPP